MLATVENIQGRLADLAGGLGDMAVATSLVPEVVDGNSLVGQERVICHSFRHPRRQAEFLAGRLAARRALGVYLGGRAVGLEVGKNASGAPIVAGHPDLRRILLYPEFEGHPLRKDYPAELAQPLVPYRDVPNIEKVEPFGPYEGMSFGRKTHHLPRVTDLKAIEGRD